MDNKESFATEQENFWSGSFGADYITRNNSQQLFASNLSYFVKALDKAEGLQTIFEVGANVGMNLKALQALYPTAELSAIEINREACVQLAEVIGKDNVNRGSILDFQSSQKFDLVFTKGVLIHLSPDYLAAVYDKLANLASKYVLIGEYYNPSPVSIEYRGHTNKLFKRDFCGEFLEAHPEFRLMDYGFAYHKDPHHPQDDITWFLLEK